MLGKIKEVFDKINASGIWKKRIAVVAVGMLLLLVLVSGLLVGDRYRIASEERQRRAEMGNMLLWYTNDSLTDYLEYAAQSYEEITGMRVVPKKVSPADYIKTIYAASVSDTVSTPDVFLGPNEMLEQAYLAGVASDQYVSLSGEEFPQTALNAVTYKGKQLAYPFYFDTSILFYNEKYVQEIPSSMDAMLQLADNMEIPEGVENILKWDCSNGLRNYFFCGKYINLAGDCGDNAQELDVCNDALVQGLQYFQTMNDYFSIDIDTVSEKVLIEEFVAGKTVFCFGDTSWFQLLEEKGMTDYGVAVLPDLNDNLDSRGIAITNVAVINGFSNKQEEAAAFAEYLTMECAGELYALSGKVTAASGLQTEHTGCLAARQQYETCAQLPKLMNMGDFWVQFEIALDDIWKGGDAAAIMAGLENKTISRIQ